MSYFEKTSGKLGTPLIAIRPTFVGLIANQRRSVRPVCIAYVRCALLIFFDILKVRTVESFRVYVG